MMEPIQAIWIFHGQEYEYINVGDATTYSTQGNNMIPMPYELENGRFLFHWDEQGREFPRDPNVIYQKAKELGYYDYTEFHNYWVRIIAVYSEGDSPISEANWVTVNKLAKPERPLVVPYSNNDGNDTGYINVTWDKVDD